MLLDFVTYTISTKIIGDKSQFLPWCSGISDKTLSWRPLRSRFPLKKIPGTEFLGYLILDFGEVSTHRTFLCTIRYGVVLKIRQHSFAIFEPLSSSTFLYLSDIHLTSIFDPFPPVVLYGWPLYCYYLTTYFEFQSADSLGGIGT